MKPCKYCKEEVDITVAEHWAWKYDSKPEGYYVKCGYCGARGPFRSKQNEAILLWDGDRIIVRKDKEKETSK